MSAKTAYSGSVALLSDVTYDRNHMSTDEFDSILERGYQEALEKEGENAETVYKRIIAELRDRANV